LVRLSLLGERIVENSCAADLHDRAKIKGVPNSLRKLQLEPLAELVEFEDAVSALEHLVTEIEKLIAARVTHVTIEGLALPAQAKR
jgi:hypothetical protein